jgi:hypothetical protein
MEFKNDMHTDTYIAGNKLEATQAFENSPPHLYSIFYRTHGLLRNSSQEISSQSVIHIIPLDSTYRAMNRLTALGYI